MAAGWKSGSRQGLLWRLEDAVKEVDAPLLQNVFRELIAKIELRWKHEKKSKLTRCRLEGGVVALRAGQEVYELSASAIL
jgi:hypothetical protein